MITAVARVLIYSLMSFEWIVLAVFCFIAHHEMIEPHHKKLLFWLMATAAFKIIGYGFSAFAAVSTPYADFAVLGARTAFGCCLIPFFITIYQVYRHIQYTRHKKEIA